MAHVLVVGATGVTGGAIVRHLAARPAWDVTAVSRRATAVEGVHHVSVDLSDADATRVAFTELGGVTHLVYAAYVDRPMSEATAPNLAMLSHTLNALAAAGAPVERAVLIGGGKSYGEHLGAYKTPAKESDPRHIGPIFYNDQEDLLTGDAAERGYSWTVLRPDLVVGPSTGSAMNLLTTIAAYAALCKRANVPLRFPGSPRAWTALHQVTDADLLAEATAWALTSPRAADEVFNITNGDLFRWEQIWPAIAEVFDLAVAPPQPMAVAEQMADKAVIWDRMVSDHDLTSGSLEEVASWPFVEGVWNMGYDLVHSTIKTRQAGFDGCRDSHDSLTQQLRQLRNQRFVP